MSMCGYKRPKPNLYLTHYHPPLHLTLTYTPFHTHTHIQTHLQHDVCIVLGDLNFRMAANGDEILSSVSQASRAQ